MKLLRHLAPLAFGIAALAPAHANPFANGGFESPGSPPDYSALGPGSTYITDWTTILTGVEYFRPAAFPGLGTAIEGVMVVDLANTTNSSGGIEQTFDTTPLQQYTLTFSAGNSTFSGRTGDGTVNVQVGNLTTSVATATATGTPIEWKPIALTFTALTSATTLSFSNTQDSFTHFAFIDAVGVSAVPEPQTVALMLAGLAVVGTVARRRRG